MNVQGKGQLYNKALKFTPAGTPVFNATLRTAKKDKKTGEWSSTFYNLVAFNDMADDLNKINEKARISVTGYWQQRTWTDKQGQKRINHEIIVQNFEADVQTQTPSASAENFDDIPF